MDSLKYWLRENAETVSAAVLFMVLGGILLFAAIAPAMDNEHLILNKELELTGGIELVHGPGLLPFATLLQGERVVVEECSRDRGDIQITVRSEKGQGWVECTGRTKRISACAVCIEALSP